MRRILLCLWCGCASPIGDASESSSSESEGGESSESTDDESSSSEGGESSSSDGGGHETKFDLGPTPDAIGCVDGRRLRWYTDGEIAQPPVQLSVTYSYESASPFQAPVQCEAVADEPLCKIPCGYIGEDEPTVLTVSWGCPSGGVYTEHFDAPVPLAVDLQLCP